MGRHEPLVAQATTRSVAVIAIVGERGDDDAGVDNDQRASRSDRTALTAFVSGARPPARPPARSRTSSRVGVWASSRRRPRRYSWSDIPAAAARRRSVAWTSSGTSLTWMLGTLAVYLLWRQYGASTSTSAPVGLAATQAPSVWDGGPSPATLALARWPHPS